MTTLLARASHSRNVKKSKKTSKKTGSTRKRRPDSSEEAIKAAERMALTAFGSGLKIAAALGTAAAKTASLALASLASGADKFSELVREEALRSSNGQHSSNTFSNTRSKTRNRVSKVRRKRTSR